MNLATLSTLVLILAFIPWAHGCRCIQPTLTSSFANNDIVIRAKVIRQLQRANGRRLYSANVQHVYKGCSLEEGERIVISTADNSAACGVTLASQTSYVLTGNLDDVVSSDNNSTRLLIGSCQYKIRWNNLSGQARRKLNKLQSELPPCECTAADCNAGPIPSVYPCADGSLPGIKCKYITATKRCGYEVDPCPIQCLGSLDCTSNQYCSQEGICRDDGTCGETIDCINPNNNYPVIECVGYLQCSNGRCGRQCGPECPPDAPLQNCSFPPCIATLCAASRGQCVDYYCGSCQGICF